MIDKTQIRTATKLVKTLKGLQSNEVLALKKFMEATYFVKPLQRKALDEVLLFYPDFVHPCFTYEDIYAKIFPLEKYNHKKLLRIFSEIRKIAEDFLAFYFLEKSPSLLERIKAIFWYQRIDFTIYNKLITKALTHLKKQATIFASFEKQTLLHLLHYYPFSEKDKERIAPPIAANKSLDELFLLNKLRFYLEFQSRKKMFKGQEGFTFKEEVLKMAATLRADQPLIDLYLNLVALTEKDKMADKLAIFLTAKEQFSQQLSSLPDYEVSIIFICLTNFAIQQYYHNAIAFRKPQFELYQLGLEHNLFSPKGHFAHTTFMNIVNTAIGVEAFDFAENFIATYSPQLKAEHIEPYRTLATVYLHFNKKEYIAAHEAFYKLESKKIFYDLPVRFLAVRLTFEKLIHDASYEKTFYSQLKSFHNFLAKHKVLSSERKLVYTNHLAFLLEIKCNMLDQKTTISLSFKEQLLEKIATTNPLIGQSYLLEKVTLLYEE